MGNLFDELQKWIKSPAKPIGQLKSLPPQQNNRLKGKGVGQKVVKINPSTNEAIVIALNTPYLVGQYALDIAQLAGISIQSLAYRTGGSPFFPPFALRFSPSQAYIDLGKLSPWDQWRVFWTRVGAHYFQDNQNAADRGDDGENGR